MKKLLIIILALFLTGCVPVQKDTLQESQMNTQEESIDTGHTDHHSAQTRKARNFFLEHVDNELGELYLAYNEPDGCVTRLCNVTRDPHSERLEPQLIHQNNAFYYLLYEEGYGNDYGKVLSDGYLYRIDFSGEKTSLQVPESFTLGHIIRTDESYIYCTANDGKNYLRADLALTGWEETTKETAEE